MAKLTKRQRSDRHRRIRALRDAARYLQAAASELAEIDNPEAEAVMGIETGMVRCAAAERRALSDKAEDLLEQARRVAERDYDLTAIWEPKNPRGPLAR